MGSSEELRKRYEQKHAISSVPSQQTGTINTGVSATDELKKRYETKVIPQKAYNWANKSYQYANKVYEDAQKRTKGYQSSATLKAYNDVTNKELTRLIEDSPLARDYANTITDPTKKSEYLKSIDAMDNNLREMRSGLHKEVNYWSKYKNQVDYAVQMSQNKVLQDQQKQSQGTDTPNTQVKQQIDNMNPLQKTGSWLSATGMDILAGINKSAVSLLNVLTKFTLVDPIQKTDIRTGERMPQEINPLKQGMELANQRAAEEQNNRANNFQNVNDTIFHDNPFVKKTMNITHDFLVAAGEAVPQVVFAMMSGNPVSTIESFAPAAGNILGILKSAISATAKNPSFWYSVGQTLGNTYDSAKAEGASDRQAAMTAWLNSILGSVIEVGGGFENHEAYSSAIKKLAHTAVEEGLEEPFQGVIENLVKKTIYDPNRPWASTTDPNAVLNPVRAAQEFAGGAVVGGLLGGAEIGTQHVANRVFNGQSNVQPTKPIQQAPQIDSVPSIDRLSALFQGAEQPTIEVQQMKQLLQEGKQTNDVTKVDGVITRLQSMKSNITANRTATTAINPVVSAIDDAIVDVQTERNAIEGGDIYNMASQVAGVERTATPIRQAPRTNTLNETNTDRVINAPTEQNAPDTVFERHNELPTKATASLGQGGAEVTITGIKSVENGQVVVKVEDLTGNIESIDASEIEFHDPNVQMIYKNASNYNTDTADMFVNEYKGMVDIETYSKGFRNMYVSGKLNLGMDQSLKTNSAYAPFIGEMTMRAAYYSGQIDVDAQTQTIPARPQETSVKQVKDAKLTISTKEQKLSDINKVLYEAVVKKTGHNVTVKSGGKDSKVNAEYIKGLGEFLFNQDSENQVSDIVHELGELGSAWDNEGFAKVRNKVLRWFVSADSNYTEDLIQNYKERYSAVDEFTTFEDASNEMVRDAFSAMLTAPGAVENFTEWLFEEHTETEAKGIVQTFIDFINDIIDRIKAYLSDTGLSTRAARSMAQANIDTLADILNDFESMVDTASNNYKEYVSGNKSLETVLLENFPEYNNNQEAMKLAKEAIEDLSKSKYSISDTGRKVDGDGIITLADGISRELINHGYVNLKGKKVKNAEDLATIAQIFRDPRFETLRIFYLKGTKIVAHEGMTSRIPGSAAAFLNIPKRSNYKNKYEWADAYAKWHGGRFDDMKNRMQRLKADGYYMLHNHPAGTLTASSADLRVTVEYKENVPGFKGHVIINSNKYGTISVNGTNASADILDLKQQTLEMFMQPTIQNEILNQKIGGSEGLANLAKSLQLSKDRSTIIYADARLNIRGVQEVPNGMINKIDSFKGYLRNQARYFGSQNVFIVTNSLNVSDETGHLIEEKYLTDSVFISADGKPFPRREEGHDPDAQYAWAGIKENNLSAYRTNEDNVADEYSLNEDSEGNKLTDEQVEYFKDSKVRDAGGNLTVVYHGTAENITTFDKSKLGTTTKAASASKGFFFTNTKRLAEQYSQFSRPTAITSLESKANRLEKVAQRVRTNKAWNDYYKAYEAYETAELNYAYNKDDVRKTSEKAIGAYLNLKNPLIHDFKGEGYRDTTYFELLQQAENEGNDGAIFKNTYDGMGDHDSFENPLTDVFVAFEPNQIKAIDNTEPTFNQDIRYSIREEDPPKNTIKAYKLLRVKKSEPGKLFPLFVESDKETPMGVWLDAEEGEMRVNEKTGTMKVKSKLGDLAYRPGWHLGDIPLATHIGIKGDSGNIEFMNPDHVWVEADVAADVNYQDEAYQNGTNSITGKLNKVKADLKKLPINGFYRYKTNPNMTGEWIITGAMRINRILSDDEAFKIVRENGYEPLPRAKGSDIRFSLKDAPTGDMTILQRENKKLQQANEYLSHEFELTTGHNISDSSVDKLAAKILSDYGSKYKKESLISNLKKLFDYIANADNVNWDEVMNITTNISSAVMSESKSMNAGLYDQYKPLRTRLRTTGITLNDVQKQEVSSAYDSYGNFMKKNFGRISIQKDGIGLDTIWKELSEEYPELFDANISDADQPLKLVEILDSIQPYADNAHGFDSEAVAYDLAMTIYDEYFNLPEVQTFADKASDELALTKTHYKNVITGIRKESKVRYDRQLIEVKKANADRIQKLRDTYNNASAKDRVYYGGQLKKLMDRKNDQLDRQRARYIDQRKETTVRRNENATIRKYRTRIEKNSNDLLKWLEHPTDSKHIPHFLRKTVGNFLLSIDLSSPRLNSKGEPTKKTMRWNDAMKLLEYEFRNISNEQMGDNDATGDSKYQDLYMDIAPEFVNRLSAFVVTNMGVTDLNDLNSEQMRDLDFLVGIVKGAVMQANKLHANGKYQNTVELGMSTVKELEDQKTIKERTQGGQLFNDVLNVEMLDSFSYMDELGDAAVAVHQAIRKGFDKRIRNLEAAQKYMKTLIGKTDLNDWTGKNAKVHKFTVKGGTIELTTSQIISLRELVNREQSKVDAGQKSHIYGGGIRPGDITVNDPTKILGKVLGAKTKVQYSPLTVTDEDVKNILSVLSDEQIKIADGMQKFLANECADWGNEATIKMYQYEKFKDPNYWPIKSDDNYTKTKDPDSNNGALYAIANSGFTKELTPGANNPIVLYDAFDVFTDHVVQMSTYNSMLAPLSDAMHWFNFRNKTLSDDDTIKFNSVKKNIQRVLGNQGKAYFTNLIKDINGTVREGRSTGIASRWISNVKVAAIGSNLRAVLQQPAAFVRASVMVANKYLLGAFTRKPRMDLAKKYSAITLWKTWGFYDTYVNKSMKEIITGISTPMERVKQLSMILMEKADEVTWGYLWNAIEDEIKVSQPGLKVGSEEFYQAVGDRLSEVVDRTQVVDTVLHKSQITRSNDFLVKITVPFMSEPIKTYNMIRNAGRTYIRNKKTVAATAIFARTLIAVLTSQLLAGAFAAIADTLRDKDKEKTLTDKYATAFLANAAENLNPLSTVPYFRDVVSIAGGFEVTRMDIQGIQSAYWAFTAWKSVINGTSKKTPYDVIYATAKAFSQIKGIPIANAMREVKGIYDTITAPPVEPKKDTPVVEQKEEGKNGLENLYDFFLNQKSEETTETKTVKPVSIPENKYKYSELNGAIESTISGGSAEDITNIRDTMISEGRDLQNIKSQVTEYFKPIYKQMYTNKDSDGMRKVRLVLNKYFSYSADSFSTWIKT